MTLLWPFLLVLVNSLLLTLLWGQGRAKKKPEAVHNRQGKQKAQPGCSGLESTLAARRPVLTDAALFAAAAFLGQIFLAVLVSGLLSKLGRPQVMALHLLTFALLAGILVWRSRILQALFQSSAIKTIRKKLAGIFVTCRKPDESDTTAALDEGESQKDNEQGRLINDSKKSSKKSSKEGLNEGLHERLQERCRCVFRESRDFLRDIVGVMRTFSGKHGLALIIVLVILLYTGFFNVLLPVHSWDGFMYHLFLPASWLQHGSLDVFPAPPQLGLDKWIYFPANTELFFAWHMLMAGSDDLVEFMQFPFLLTGLLALFALARLLGVANKRAVWTMPLFASIPLVVCQLNSSYVDVAVASLFFASVYALVRGWSNDDWWMVAAGVLLAAILLGSKASGPLLAGLAFGAAWLGALMLRVGRICWKRLLLFFGGGGLVAGLAVLLVGGYFFARNYSRTQNPLYPYGLTVMGEKLFDGIDPARQTASEKQKDKLAFLLYTYKDSFEVFTDMYYGHPYAGHGPVPLVAGIPALGLFLLLFMYRRDFRRLLLFLVLGGASFLSVYLLPSLFPRFALPLTGFAIIAVTGAWEALRPGRALLQLLLLLMIAVNLLWTAGMNFHRKWYLKEAWESSRKLSAADSPYSGRHFRRLDRLAGPRKLTIAYSGLMQPYPLFGSELTRRVLYLPPGDKQEEWLKRMEEEKVVFLVLGHNSDPGERRLAFSRPGTFRLLWQNRKISVFLRRSPENKKLYRELVSEKDS